MASRRTFRILTYSQLSGTKVKAVIRPKYNNLYIVMIQCTHYKNYYTFKASNYNTHQTKQQHTKLNNTHKMIIQIVKKYLTFDGTYRSTTAQLWTLFSIR
jgi:hypothetical protein